MGRKRRPSFLIGGLSFDIRYLYFVFPAANAAPCLAQLQSFSGFDIWISRFRRRRIDLDLIPRSMDPISTWRVRRRNEALSDRLSAVSQRGKLS
jgi:hypothetical protein